MAINFFRKYGGVDEVQIIISRASLCTLPFETNSFFSYFFVHFLHLKTVDQRRTSWTSCLILIKINEITSNWNHLNEERKYFDPIRNYMSSSILLVNTRNLIFNRNWYIFIKKRIVIGKIVRVERREESKRRWDGGKKSLLTTIVFSWNWTVAIFHPLLSQSLFSLAVFYRQKLCIREIFFTDSPTPFCGIKVFVISSVIARIDPKINRLGKVNPSRRKWNYYFFYFSKFRPITLSRFALIISFEWEFDRWNFALKFICWLDFSFACGRVKGISKIRFFKWNNSIRKVIYSIFKFWIL